MACLFDSVVKTICSRFFDDGDPVLSVGVHHLLVIRWSGIVGIYLSILGVSGQSARCSCGY